MQGSPGVYDYPPVNEKGLLRLIRGSPFLLTGSAIVLFRLISQGTIAGAFSRQPGIKSKLLSLASSKIPGEGGMRSERNERSILDFRETYENR